MVRWLFLGILSLSLFAANPAAAAPKAYVTGSVTYRERIALSPSAVLEVTLEDVSRSDAPARAVARYRKRNPGQVPIYFDLRYRPDRIDLRGTYVVRATIHDRGQLRFTSNRAYPVLTHGHGNKVRIRLVGVSSGGGKELRGMFRYMADAAQFRDCRSGRRWPVMMRGDYRALERAYLSERGEPGSELLVSIRGRIEERPKMEGRGTESALFVEKFLRAMPGENCRVPLPRAGIEDSRWRLVRIGRSPVSLSGRQREPWIELDSNSKRLTGSGGCNRVSGPYRLGRSTLHFGPLISTKMACPGTETEAAFFRALGATRSYRIRGRALELLDDQGRMLLLLEEANLR
jgi:uncharacterized lipoprotein YbaY/heat shock protein HslJ